ncbi:MAG: hypothetical protein GY731_00590, partial [Gammaproteobacteria bacterium]|nr:hypothetical protein [Gammaproteobacteria bacterium]
SRYLQDPEEDSRSPAPDSRPATNEILLQLLERFEVSSDMQGQVDSLKAELASEIPPPKLPLILETMANLVADIRRAAQKEKAEIEAFLKDITDRLIELDSNLQQAGASRRESLANGQEFRNTVNTQVAQMRTSVSIATDLEQLKATIVDGLDGVQQHLETYILTEEKQNLDAEHQIQELG